MYNYLVEINSKSFLSMITEVQTEALKSGKKITINNNPTIRIIGFSCNDKNWSSSLTVFMHTIPDKFKPFFENYNLKYLIYLLKEGVDIKKINIDLCKDLQLIYEIMES